MSVLNFNFAQDVVDRLASERRTGLIFVDEFGHRRDYTFAEISTQSQQYAQVLRAFGVSHGDRTILRTSNTAKCAFIVLALQRLGAVAVPCPESWTAEQVLNTALETGARTIVTHRRHREQLEAIREQLFHDMRFIIVGEEYEGWARLDSLAARARPFAGITTQLSEPAFTADREYTNGAFHDARSYAVDGFGLRPSDVFWCTLPMGSAQWMLDTIAAPWSAGAATVVHEGAFHPLERLELVRELDVTVLAQSAAEFEGEVESSEFARLRLPRLRRALCIGGTPDAALRRKWSDARGIELEEPVSARV